MVDNTISKWHSAWQNEFETKEFAFKKINNQIKERRADVYINKHNLVIEFQHSQITKEEVDNRKHDYSLHNANIIWVIDGNKYVEKTDLDNSRVFLTLNSIWLYDSFTSYNIIYIDYQENIYKLFPKEVKNKMIDVDKPFNKINFIQMINQNNNDLYDNKLPYQCTLCVDQLGAGNGKTYGIIQKLESDNFSHYKQFIVVTKQHSAKKIIYDEFTKQISNKKLNFITNLQLLNKDTLDKDRKYILKYTNNKINTDCQMIICTIDSLMFNLGNNSVNGTDKFIKIIQSIIDDYINIKNINSLLYKKKVCIKLNKEICLIIDETQDLPINYAVAIQKLMRSRYVDALVVGDKLQSISFENNAFNYFQNNQLSYINIKSSTPINKCRRFINPILVNFCNSVIDYKKYDLPAIEPYEYETEDLTVLQFIEFYNVHNDRSKLNDNIQKIMDKYTFEVENNNCQPNDFLFVTPFTKNNIMVDSIEIAINQYWTNKNKTKYIRYAYFHKSEEGTSINTELSNNSTRIVSIHSAKGDGRKVVFVIGCDEQSLKKFSKGKINLIYESLFHVSITRMNKKLYFAYVANNDDIHQRITKFSIDNDINIKPSIKSITKIKYNDIINTDTNDDIFDILKSHIMTKCNFDDCIDDNETQMIDMQHHNIRCFCMHISFWLKVIKKNEQKKNQIYAILIKILNSNINNCSSWNEFNDKLGINFKYNNEINDENNKEQRFMCILSYNDDKNSEYTIYNQIIQKYVKSVKEKIKIILTLKPIYLCPYESIILYYMFNICEYGKINNDLTITELYEITHIYYKSFTHDINMHNECYCKKIFPNNNNNGILYNYLFSHYEKISILNNEYNNFINNNPNLNILLSHHFEYKGDNDNYHIKKKLTIGYNNDNVYIIYIYPTFNKLNHNKYLIESIYDTYLIQNRKSLKDDLKINGKIIKTVLFSCDTDIHYIFDWNNNSIDYILSNELFFKYRIYEYMVNLYTSQIKNYYNYIKYNYNESEKIKLIDKIKDIINNTNAYLNEKKENIPQYIITYLNIIRGRISKCKDKIKAQNIIDEDMLNYESFEEEMKELILDSINDYLSWDNENDDNYLIKYNNLNNIDKSNIENKDVNNIIKELQKDIILNQESKNNITDKNDEPIRVIKKKNN